MIESAWQFWMPVYPPLADMRTKADASDHPPGPQAQKTERIKQQNWDFSLVECRHSCTIGAIWDVCENLAEFEGPHYNV